MKPSIPDVIARFAAYYKHHPSWGAFHVVADGNYADAFVEYSPWRDDTAEEAALRAVLRAMSKTQRRKLIALVEAA